VHSRAPLPLLGVLSRRGNAGCRARGVSRTKRPTRLARPRIASSCSARLNGIAGVPPLNRGVRRLVECGASYSRTETRPRVARTAARPGYTIDSCRSQLGIAGSIQISAAILRGGPHGAWAGDWRCSFLVATYRSVAQTCANALDSWSQPLRHSGYYSSDVVARGPPARCRFVVTAMSHFVIKYCWMSLTRNAAKSHRP
jgi:hypothetical protein